MLLILVGVSGLLRFSFVMGIRSQVRDLKAYLPDSQIKNMSSLCAWIDKSKISRVGNLLVVGPSDTNLATALIMPASKPRYPVILIENAGGTNTTRIERVSLIDSRDKEIRVEDKDQDGTFDSYIINTGTGVNSASYQDRDFDGTFDVCLRPSGKNELMLSNAWHSFHFNEGRDIVVEMGDGKEIVLPKPGKQ